MRPLNPTELATLAPANWSAPPARTQERLGCDLKLMFDSLTSEPMPDRLMQLAAAVDEAFRRGELQGGRARSRSS